MEAWVAAAATKDLAVAIAGVANAIEIARENATAHGHTSVVWAIDALDVQEPPDVTRAKRAFESRVSKELATVARAAASAPEVVPNGIFVDGKTLPTHCPRAVVAYWHLMHPAWGCSARLEGASAFEAIEHATGSQWVRDRAGGLLKMVNGLVQKRR